MTLEILNTPRLCIKALTTQDALFLIALMGTNEWKEFIGDRHIVTEVEALTYIEKILDTPDFYYWVVYEKETQQAIGIVSFIKRNYLPYFDIGFAFLPAFMGYGYAREAVTGLLLEILATKHHKEILSITLPKNKRAIRLLTQIDFYFVKAIEHEGEVLEVYCLS